MQIKLIKALPHISLRVTPSPPTNENGCPNGWPFSFVAKEILRELNPRPVRARGEQGIRTALLRACERQCACRRVGWPGWTIPTNTPPSWCRFYLLLGGCKRQAGFCYFSASCEISGVRSSAHARASMRRSPLYLYKGHIPFNYSPRRLSLLNFARRSRSGSV